MKIIFMGTPSFAVPSLNILLENNYDIISVVTVPDKKMGRGQILSQSEVKKFAVEKSLNILQPENLKDEAFISKLKSMAPVLIIVVAFKILPPEIFTIPKLGSVNLHASLLPKYRGAAPINWALINGEKETGVTTFFLEKKVDTGNIILQRKTDISEADNAGTLQERLSKLGADLVLDTVRLIEAGKAFPVKQDNSLLSAAPKIFKDDCFIDWNNNSAAIHNFIRGLSPYPAAVTHFDSKLTKIYKSSLTKLNTEGANGKIIIIGKNLYASTADYLLEILELQIEGKRKITAAEFINGMAKGKEIFFK